MRHYRTHENVKPYECSVCGQTFGRKDLRDRHERNVHQAVRPTAPRRQSEGPITANVSSDGGSSPTRSAATVMSSEVQRPFLQLFFTCFAPSLPLIHQATFDPALRSPGLVRCMAAIGGSFSTSPDMAKTSTVMLTEELASVRQLAGFISPDDPRCFDLTTEILLLVSFGLSQIDGRGFDVSRDIFRRGIDLARNLGVGKPLLSKAARAPESLHHRWLEWVKYETFKRLGLLYFVTDSLAASLFNVPSNMILLENKQTLPVDETIWNSRSAEEWQAACLSIAANSESPAIDAMHVLLSSYRVPAALNELSSILLSAGLLNNILELSSWKALYASRTRDSPSTAPQHFGTGPRYGPEVNTREAQLKFSLNVMLDRARNQRLNIAEPSRMWDITSTIQQFGYLRLYLPSFQASHGIVSSDWPEIMRETIPRVLKEDLSNVDYRPVTLLLNFFIELILSQVHLQYRDASRVGNASYGATESTTGCVILVQVMVDIWRLLRFTLSHTSQISRSPELSLARQSFLTTVTELSDSVGGSQGRTTIIQEDELARSLAQLCLNMYHATRMRTFQLAAEQFAHLHELLHEEGFQAEYQGPQSAHHTWAMISRCI